MNQYFKKVNKNPRGIRTGDCVIRAIANAEGREWLEVFDDLTKLARKLFTTPTHGDCYKVYLDKYEKMPALRQGVFESRKHRVRPEEFHIYEDLRKGTFIVRQANHLTVVRDGITEDTWDSSDRASYIIWRVK